QVLKSSCRIGYDVSIGRYGRPTTCQKSFGLPFRFLRPLAARGNSPLRAWSQLRWALRIHDPQSLPSGMVAPARQCAGHRSCPVRRSHRALERGPPESIWFTVSGWCVYGTPLIIAAALFVRRLLVRGVAGGEGYDKLS